MNLNITDQNRIISDDGNRFVEKDLMVLHILTFQPHPQVFNIGGLSDLIRTK